MLKKLQKILFQGEIPGSAWLVILLGTLSWSLTMVKSGLTYAFGMGFWGPNGHDGVWHIALINQLAKGSGQMPVFAGEALQNYHVGFDLLLATIHKITRIPAHNLYFQIIPPLLALAIGVLVYKFVYLWQKSKSSAFWATFFVYFGGSFGWIVTLIRERQLGGESMFWAQQSISTLINPPFALSIILILVGLIYLVRLGGKANLLNYSVIIFSFGVLSQVKVYASVLVLISLGTVVLWALFKYWTTHSLPTALHRSVGSNTLSKGVESRRLLVVFLGSLAVSLLLFLPLNRGSTGLLVYQPFWFLETMMGLSDRFYWPRFHSAMTNYKLANNWIKAVPAYLIAFAIFWFGNLGTRVIKEVLVFKWIKNFKKVTHIDVFFASVIAAGVVLPMFFLQKGTPWNTIQFIYYSLMFSGILAGVWLGEFLGSSRGPLAGSKRGPLLKYVVGGMVVLLTLPTTIGTLRHYLPSRPPAKLSHEELRALKFLSEQPKGIVLTYPFDPIAAEAAVANPPRPLYLYASTAYVAAFSQKPVFLEDEINLDITGYDWPARREKVLAFLESQDKEEVRGFLKENNIAYIYWLKAPEPDSAGRRVPSGTRQRAALGESQLGIERIFENSEVDIYKVN